MSPYVNTLFLLNGNIEDDDLRPSTSPLDNTDFQALKTGHLKNYVATIQNSMIGTGATSWLMCVIASKVYPDDPKVVIYNLAR